MRLLPLIRQTPGDHLLFGIDDTPTARYGPCVQAPAFITTPAPAPPAANFLYGHIWVTLAWLVRHPAWHTLSLPLLALLYVRKKDVPQLVQAHPWEFATKLELAADLVRWLTSWLSQTGKALWLVADGAYAKRPFLRPIRALGWVVFSRAAQGCPSAELARDAASAGNAGRCRRTAPGKSTWPSVPVRSVAGSRSCACSTQSA